MCLRLLMLALHCPYQHRAGVISDSLKMYMNYAFFRGDLTSHVVDSILKSPLCANSEPEISDSLVDSDLSLKILHPKLTDCWLPPPFVSWYIVKVRSQDADCVLFCNVSWSSQPHAEPTQFLAKWQLWKSTNQQNNAILEKLMSLWEFC